MKVLFVHNRYQNAGGEDVAFEFETSLLTKAGHNVHRLIVSNDEIKTFADKMRTSWALPWNPRGFALIEKVIRHTKPDIMHVFNFFALLSPSIYDAATEAKVPVVQTLHNFRTVCANALLLRNGIPCELCISGSPYNAVRYRCFRGSAVGSLMLARMIAAHRRNGTWTSKVARFIALSEFSRSRFVAAGFPAEKIVVKPNGVNDAKPRGNDPGTGALFVGRLSEEKGVRTLLEAARLTSEPIRIIGDGPLYSELKQHAPTNVSFLGHLSADSVLEEMRRARCLVIPSICYENFPMTVAEACSVGLPVIASKLGSLAELVENEIVGLQVTPGHVRELAQAVDRLAEDPKAAIRMGHAARKKYEERFTPNRILSALEAIYDEVVR